MHKILEEFEFRPDRTTDYGVCCPWASKKFCIDLKWENAVSMLARSFLIKLSSKLLVTRTDIKAQTSLISGQVRLLTLELLALEWQKFYTFELDYLLRPVGQSWSDFMCSITGDGERLHDVFRLIRSKLLSMATESPHWLIMGKMVPPPFLRCFRSDLFYTCRQ